MQKVLASAASISVLILFAATALESSIFWAALDVLGTVYIAAIVPLAFIVLGLRQRRSWKGKAHMAVAVTVLFVIAGSAFRGEPVVGDETLAGVSLLEMFGLFLALILLLLPALLSVELSRHRSQICGRCLSRVPIEASRCRFCTSDVFPSTATMPDWSWRSLLLGDAADDRPKVSGQ
jgi:ribosomal protein L40E